MISYSGAKRSPRSEMIEAHQRAWQQIGEPGTWWRAAHRVAMIDESRAARSCTLCSARAVALSPAGVQGQHDRRSGLDPIVVDLVHRLTTDPGRLTRAWFDQIIASGLSGEQYVEAVSVVSTAVLIDTEHRAVGLDPPPLPTARAGEPARTPNPDCVAAGAWVPMAPASASPNDTGLPAVPNIFRAMSLVPSAVALFFTAFRPHYALKDLPLAISQDQAEFVAARVSALNQCFY